jgi:hypothetical protein
VARPKRPIEELAREVIERDYARVFGKPLKPFSRAWLREQARMKAEADRRIEEQADAACHALIERSRTRRCISLHAGSSISIPNARTRLQAAPLVQQIRKIVPRLGERRISARRCCESLRPSSKSGHFPTLLIEHQLKPMLKFSNGFIHGGCLDITAQAKIQHYTVFTFCKSLTTVSLHDIEGDAAA